MVNVNGREWCGNGLVFATRLEAEGNALALMSRWLLVTDTRADETNNPVSHRWDRGELTNIGVPADG
jgi:hypothetical protein